MALIHLEVVTPTGPVVSEEVDIVTAPGVGGEFGVLANHAPFLSTIKTGTLSFKKDRQTRYLMVSGGFSEVSNNKITFLVESAEFGNAIDVERALRAKERAEKRLASGTTGH
jgi:F-type H+-transporting ATPase subunit epsilon